jgi:hypothetical protein
MCLQVYHYTGVRKDQSISAWDPKSMGEGVPDDDVWHTDDLEASCSQAGFMLPGRGHKQCYGGDP